MAERVCAASDRLGVEAFNHEACREMLEAELAAYRRLGKEGGGAVPRFLGEARFAAGSGGACSEELPVGGILIEYLPGVTMAEFVERAGVYVDWQAVCEQAMAAVDALTRCGVVNSDLHLGNLLVGTDAGSASGFRVAIIDFGYSRTLGVGESREEWAQRKWEANEKGGVGREMWRRLFEMGVDLRWEKSLKVVPVGEFWRETGLKN